MSYYAYYLIEEQKSGVVNTWEECKNLTTNKKSRYKKFSTLSSAKEWIKNGCIYEKKENIYPNLDENAIYFDAGTGRGIGVEVRVTNINRQSILSKIIPENLINKYGNYQVAKNRTNNFGELTGAFFALKLALKYNIKLICGDSKLVIDYWINCRYNKANIDNDTIKLIEKTNKLYIEYKLKGGKISRISGDINPADLGFHK